jgi:uncharacterized membrane-anchored protein YitT (DUF2179 family)
LVTLSLKHHTISRITEKAGKKRLVRGRKVNGFYAVYYTGVSGFGNAVLVITGGIVVGADVVGGVYDGSFSQDQDGKFSASISLTVPAGTTLVTGQILPNPFTQTITAILPPDFANGQSLPIQTTMGPVNAIFKKLRDLP